LVERQVMLERAAKMRREPTEAEKRLWRYLSGSKLGGYKFRRQKVESSRIFDFFCPAKGLIVEIDGETHDRQLDLERDIAIQRATGFITLRVTNEDVMRNMDGVLTLILTTLADMPDRWDGHSA
jgi:very-short-patch-repair endonuclease